MTKVPPPSDVVWLSEAQLRVLAGARTQDVWSCFSPDEARTAAQIQSALGLESKTVYYQLRKLVRAGLLVEEADNGRAARFRMAARGFSMPNGFQGAEYERLAARMVASKLRQTMRQFERTADRASDSPDLADWLYIHSERLRLSPEDFRELNRRMRELLEEYVAKEGSQGARYLLVATPELE